MKLNRRIDHYEPNTSGGRDLIVGDIHGHFTKLAQALHAVGFDTTRDRLFSVGDLVDRGPQSEQASAWMASYPWFHPIRGNHEEMAILWANCELELSFYLANGGKWNALARQELVQERAAIFATMPVAIELETDAGLVVIAHADCPAPTWAEMKAHLAHADPAIAEAAANCVTWSRSRVDGEIKGRVKDVRAVVVGHTVVPRLTAHDNVLHIDTGGWLRGEFTLLDAETLLPAAPRVKEAACS